MFANKTMLKHSLLVVFGEHEGGILIFMLRQGFPLALVVTNPFTLKIKELGHTACTGLTVQRLHTALV